MESQDEGKHINIFTFESSTVNFLEETVSASDNSNGIGHNRCGDVKSSQASRV